MLSEDSKQKLLCLADWLETTIPARGFDMNHWANGYNWTKWVQKEDQEPDCGTQCCIAGWVCLAKGYKINDAQETKDRDGKNIGNVPDVAASILGISSSDARRLFWPSNWPGADHYFNYNRFPNTPKGAADRIRYFVETGR